jgi:hypothetical protein
MFPSQLYSYAPGNRVFSAIDRLVKSFWVEEAVEAGPEKQEVVRAEEGVEEAVEAGLGKQEVVRAEEGVEEVVQAG